MENSDKKVAIYCRVSTQQQTTDRQREDLLKFAKRENIEIDEKYIFIDIISGFKKGEVRPQYSTMLEYVEKGHVGKILFSEFSRLARNATDLLEQIKYFRERKVALYFDKQKLWVKDESDLGSTILLHILAVMSSYEIELFTERTLSGKIAKIQAGHGGGDEHAYGYKNNERKEIVKDEEEANIVSRIFEMYANGDSSLRICDWLNGVHIPSPYKRRLDEFKKNRANKGLEEKAYKFNEENLKWRPSTINRLLHNELYIGKRHIVLYKPDPTNPLPKEKRDNREIVFTYDKQEERLRIVSDELFQLVQDRLLRANYNKNNAIRHDNLLKHLLICGECESNFSVGKNESREISLKNGGRTYKCYGTVSRKDKPKTCTEGAELRMWKFDGLVLQLSLMMFADKDMSKRCEYQIVELTGEVTNLEKALKVKEAELGFIRDKYKKTMGRLASTDSESDDDVIGDLMRETKAKFAVDSEGIQKHIDRIEKDILTRKMKITSLRKMGDTSSLYKRMDEIQNDRVLIKSLVDEYIEVIKVYRLCKLWCLVVVQYKDESEVWGTLKAARYKKEELFYSPDVCKYGVEIQTWIVPNWDKAFTYDKEQKRIYCNGKSSIEGIKEGFYTFEEFDKEIRNHDMIGSFPMYDYENGRFVSAINNNK